MIGGYSFFAIDARARVCVGDFYVTLVRAIVSNEVQGEEGNVM